MENENLFTEIDLTLNRDDAQTVVSILDHPEQNALPGLSGYYEVLYDETRSSSDSTKLMLYFPESIPIPEASVEILVSALNITDYQLLRKNIDKISYLEAYKEHYKPFRITEHFVIVPSWHKGQPLEQEILVPGSIPLYLDPGLAFGTGQHPTTRLCLDYIDQNPLEGQKIIDAGTGSGILTIGALLQRVKHVYAFDVDSNAISAVRQNMELNLLDPSGITLETGGFELPGLKSFDADIMIANITASVLLASMAWINGGNYKRMVLSGILSDKKDELIRAFESSDARWKCEQTRDSDGWSLLELIR